MKYEDMENIENQIINNDYVSYDVSPRRSARGLKNKRASLFRRDKAADLLIIPVMVLTAVSLGFLIAQIAKYASLSAITSILT